MAAEITSALGVSPELIEASNGIFDVEVEDELVFSKYESGRFPEPDEVITAIRARLAAHGASPRPGGTTS